MYRSRIAAFALAVAAPLAARALDAPHDQSTVLGVCDACHMLHNTAGAGLTKVAGNANLCASCHDSKTTHGFPFVSGDQAVPGTSGRSHSWSGAAVNAQLGTTTPASAAMASRLDGGNLTCSTCHDQHNNSGSANAGTQYTSYPVGVAQNRTTPAGAGTGQITLLQPAAGAAAKGYKIVIVGAGNATSATFKVSNDNGTSFFGCTAPATYTYVAYNNTTPNPCRAGASIPLNDGANVSVTFTGTFAANDTWQFHVAYPFLRMANAEAQMCVDCHKDRDQAWQDVEGAAGGRLASITLGTTRFSHPVGQGLNANAKGYDRAAPLETTGGAQGADGNGTNDLVLSPTNKVTCLTCHHPHNADSNSLSIDAR